MPLLDAALLDGLGPEARVKRRVDWPTLIRIGGLASLTENTDRVLAAAARLTGRPPSLPTLLDALDAGLMVDLGADPTSPADPSHSPRVRRERSRLIVHKALNSAVIAVLTEVGAVQWRESWPSTGTMRLHERYQDSLHAVIDAAVSDPPDTRRVRALLDSTRKPQERQRPHGTATGHEDPRPHRHAQRGQGPRTVAEAIHGVRVPPGNDRADQPG
jgi:hypothetical protein